MFLFVENARDIDSRTFTSPPDDAALIFYSRYLDKIDSRPLTLFPIYFSRAKMKTDVITVLSLKY